MISQKILKVDEVGNKLVYEENRDVTPIHMSIELMLVKGRKRHLAYIITVEGLRVLYLKRTRTKHLMTTMNAYGFNDVMLKETLDSPKNNIEYVYLVDEHGAYGLRIEYILKEGTYKHFKVAAFERQIFLKLDLIEKCKL